MAMWTPRVGLSVCVASVVFALAGCASAPPRSYAETLRDRPMEVLRTERGEIIAVNDIMIEPTSARRVVASSSEAKTPAGPPPMQSRRRALGIPLGGGPALIPGEEITVKLANGKLLMIVQEQSSPAMAKGEKVRVVTEQIQGGLGTELTRVVRDY